MTETILVLGATGTTGRRIAYRLSDRGVTVRAASRTSGSATRFAWNDPSTHGPALEGASALYLVPRPLAVDPSAEVAALLATARRSGVQRVVACSSLGVTFPGEPVDSGRRSMEHAITSSGLEWTLLRPGGFMQNFSEGFLLPGILRAGGIVSATGDGATPMIDADDIADVAVAALLEEQHAGQTYALTGAEPLTFARAIELAGTAAGRTLGHRSVGSRELAAMLEGFGLPPAYAAIVVRDQEAIRDGHAARVSPDVERVLGRPPGSFAAFAARAAAAWRVA
jgi:uncharacterized protein YbjT (DUF2867 family)